jgi:hypothetical protein
MAINDIVSICSSVVALINKHTDTLSSDLVDSLTSAVLGRPEHGITAFKIPLIMVAMNNYTEELNTLGTGAHRDNRFTVDIYPVTRAGLGTVLGEGQAEAEKEANRLTHNIVDLIRSRPDLSGTVSFVEGVDVEFNQEFGEGSTYVKTNRIGVRCFKFIS